LRNTWPRGLFGQSGSSRNPGRRSLTDSPQSVTHASAAFYGFDPFAATDSRPQPDESSNVPSLRTSWSHAFGKGQAQTSHTRSLLFGDGWSTAWNGGRCQACRDSAVPVRAAMSCNSAVISAPARTALAWIASTPYRRRSEPNRRHARWCRPSLVRRRHEQHYHSGHRQSKEPCRWPPLCALGWVWRYSVAL
jgi:hypothetical protein